MSLPSNLFMSAFRRQRLGFLLTFILALMVYLGSLAMAAQAVLVRTSVSWGQDLQRRVTVEIPASSDDTVAARKARAQSVAAIIMRREGVTSASVVEDEETARLLRPWIADAALLASLPLPQLVDVQLDDKGGMDPEKLRLSLQDAAPGLQVHAHAAWMDSLLGFMRGLGGLAAVMLVLTALALMAVVSIVCNAAMAFQRETVELLHFMGASDPMIAAQFQRQILVLSLRAAFAGFIAAVLTVGGLAIMLGTLGGLALVQPVSWLTVAAVMAMVPAASPILAFITARLSVMRLLRRMI